MLSLIAAAIITGLLLAGTMPADWKWLAIVFGLILFSFFEIGAEGGK